MNKKKVTIMIVVFAVVCVFAVLVFSGVINPGKLSGTEESTDDAAGFNSNTYSSQAVVKGTSTVPYLKTDIENLFYTMAKDGTVKFYRFSNNTFTETEATGTYDAAVTMSETEISAKITYIEEDGVVSGYGLYLGGSDDYSLYTYAFFRLTNFSKEYSSASDRCILLVDTTPDDMYNQNKIYEESFRYIFSNASSDRLMSQANRTVGIDGTKRGDYAMLNDCLIQNTKKTQYFFSGRHYGEDEGKTDILTTGGSGNNTDNILVVSNVLDYWMSATDDGFLYITEDGDGNVVLNKYIQSDGSTEAVRTFDGTKKDGILASGNYLYIVNKNEIYSVAEDKSTSVATNFDGDYIADSFTVTGDTCVIRGYIDAQHAAIAVAKVSDGSIVKTFMNSSLKDMANVAALSDGHYMITVVSGDNYNYYVY